MTSFYSSCLAHCIEAESPEEGELAPPKQFKGLPNSPPPVNQWPPCVRMVARLDAANLATHEDDARKNVNVITAEGVEVGRCEIMYMYMYSTIYMQLIGT